jgi:hypothetical protein
MYNDDGDLSVGSIDNVVVPLPPQPQLLFDADDSTPPPLGSHFTYPVNEAIASLPTVLAKDAALVDLMKMLNDAGCPCYLFDEIVKFMERHSGTTFPAGNKIDKRETLMNHLAVRFPVPEPTPVQVVLEHGSDKDGDYNRRPGNSVLVQTWDFEKMCQSYLLDPFLFGNPNNLVNSQNPFGNTFQWDQVTRKSLPDTGTAKHMTSTSPIRKLSFCYQQDGKDHWHDILLWRTSHLGICVVELYNSTGP